VSDAAQGAGANGSSRWRPVASGCSRTREWRGCGMPDGMP